MNYKSFVFALGLLIVSGSCVYAQNKGKNVTKAVEAAVTKKVPVAGAAKAPRVPKAAVSAPKVPVAPRVPTVKTMAPTAARAGKLPPPVSASKLAGQMKAARGVDVKMPMAAPAPLPRPQFIPQFEDINYGYNVIGLKDVVEEFAVAHNRRGSRDLRDINGTFENADYHFKRDIEDGNYRPYQEVWVEVYKNFREFGRIKQSLKLYTEPDSPLQPIFKLRDQQLQHALNPGAVDKPIDQRFVLLDETSVRTAEEIKSLAKNLNVHDPLRTDIQYVLGVLEEQTAKGTSSRAFLDIFHQLPNLDDEVIEFCVVAHKRVGSHIEYLSQLFEWGDEKVFVKQGNKVYANPNIPKGTSYMEVWKKHLDGRSVRLYMLPESPLQKAFELRQEQLDYLLSDRDNFLVDPSLGNEATASTAREIQDKLSGLPENNPLRKHIESSVDFEKYVKIGQ